MFTTEKQMSLTFEKYVKANFGNAYLKECQGLFGVPDFVFYSRHNKEVSIISFELKLKDWKQAAKQAFRYKSFSNIAYVVLSSKNVNAALNNLDFFEKYNIGLAKFNTESDFEILFKPNLGMPYSENLNQKLLNVVSGSKKKVKNIGMLIK